MNGILSTAATGVQAQELNVQVISNNIANINTTAYQRSRAAFEDLLYISHRRAGVSSSDANTIIPTGIELGMGVKAGGVYRIPIEGELQQTESPLDVAIRGKGYFRIQMPDGTFAYTRDGTFQKNNNGEIVTLGGYMVMPGITIPETATSIEINPAGEVIVLLAGDTVNPQTIGQLDLVDFINTPGLLSLGDNLYAETGASGAPILGLAQTEQFGNIIQGWLETSNVNPVFELTQLISAQRAYEINSKIIQAGDEMLQTINQAKR